MKIQAIQWAVDLGQSREHIFMATSDKAGWPHVTAAGTIRRISDEKVAVSDWFCPGTVKNLEENRQVSLVVWDPVPDKGYQLLGKVEEVDEEAMLDGYDPELETRERTPQVERELVIRVEKVLDFTYAPHSDAEQ